jgi:NitT/TauT family transport system ATP-binding protein
MEPVLSLAGISKIFRDGEETCPALSGISLDIAAQEIVCIMGPSGCGKSTILRVIGGLESADSGTIHTTSDNNGGEAKTAMVFQDHALFPWLSVYENIVYGLRLSAQRVPEDEIRKRAEALLSLTHLDAFTHAYPHQLSGGMRQRVAVARALAVKPPVILMDEPFSALDPFTRRELEDEVLRIRQELKTTILFVSHNPEEAVYLADRIVILSQRPAVISETLSVSLPHPRDMADPAFIRIREQVTRAVVGDGIHGHP